MKKIKLVSLLLAVLIAAFAFSGCSKSDNDVIKVGVIQFGSHPSLDNCYEGIEAALNGSDLVEKISIDRQDGGFDSATCDAIAKNMVSKKYDIIVAIATPAAVAAYSAAMNATIPVVFCAVSDPVAAGLADSLESPGSSCTGTSDVLDLSAQLTLIKTLQPNVKKIGVLYTTGEANSVSQLASLKKLAPEFGVEIIDSGVQSAADIPQAAAALCAKVDCITNFTDNNVVNNLSVLLEQANAAGIAVYGSEVEQVANGCIAAVSIDYVELGRVTGDMALQVLGGADASKMPVRQIIDASPVVNTDVLSRFNISLPDVYKDAEKLAAKAD